jgi:curved DNA-binding protein
VEAQWPMKYKDYYETMGVARTATQAEIKTAHRKLARQYHPDLNKQAGAEERFKEVGEAYQVLRDVEKRAAYDRLGEQPANGDDFEPPPGWNEGFEFSGSGDERGADADFSDFFASMFGRGGETRQPRQAHADARGEDHHASVSIDLKDSFTGAQRSITLRMPVADAHGHVTLQSRVLNVSIPQGIRAGQRLRLAGQGGAGRGTGAAGDLYLEIEWLDEGRFLVDGRDVSIEVPVAPWEAALGANVEVPVPDGTISVSIPSNSANGRKLRLKGRGIPGAPPGDLYVILDVVLPPADSEQARAAYAAMRDALAFDPRANFNG